MVWENEERELEMHNPLILSMELNLNELFLSFLLLTQNLPQISSTIWSVTGIPQKLMLKWGYHVCGYHYTTVLNNQKNYLLETVVITHLLGHGTVVIILDVLFALETCWLSTPRPVVKVRCVRHHSCIVNVMFADEKAGVHYIVHNSFHSIFEFLMLV